MMIERKYLNSVDGYICNSQATLDSIIDCSNANLPSTIAYPGRDHILSTMSPFEIKQRAHRPGPLRLLFLGSIIRRKGLDTLLEALTGIDSSTWHLDIIGDATIDPRYSAAQKRTIRQANMSESITWHGSLSDASLEQLWSRSHVLVVPSRYEGFGIVYLEAMAKGLVPIGSSAGGAGELIEAGQDGFLVNPGDSAAIQSHILRLIGDRDFLARMAVAGAQRFHKHPTWEAAGHKIQSFLLQRIVDLP
jgi:glycosyltransferase involved in cell wall biosynthesis